MVILAFSSMVLIEVNSVRGPGSRVSREKIEGSKCNIDEL